MQGSPQVRAARSRPGALPLVVMMGTCMCPRTWLVELLELWTLDLRTASLHRARSGGVLSGLVRPQARTSRLVLVALDHEIFARSGTGCPRGGFSPRSSTGSPHVDPRSSRGTWRRRGGRGTPR